MLALAAVGDLADVMLRLHTVDVRRRPSRAGGSTPPAGDRNKYGVDEADRREELDRTTTLTGTASDLLLWLWQPPSDPVSLVIAGDPKVAPRDTPSRYEHSEDREGFTRTTDGAGGRQRRGDQQELTRA